MMIYDIFLFYQLTKSLVLGGGFGQEKSVCLPVEIQIFELHESQFRSERGKLNQHKLI